MEEEGMASEVCIPAGKNKESYCRQRHVIARHSLVKQKLLRYRRPVENPDRRGDAFMIQAFVCIGSNMGDAQEHLAKARAALASIPGVAVSGKSSLYRTEPQGRKDQP